MTKPFNLADAKAGHPVQTRDGQCATILKFDSTYGVYPLIGVTGPDDQFHRWTGMGYLGLGLAMENKFDLVMAPIGTIEGKPVYPGDMITIAGGDPIAVRHDLPFPIDAKWPRQYPETRMCGDDLEVIYRGTGAGEHNADHVAVANAAIRHGIDNGYLLDPCELQHISIKLPDMSMEELNRMVAAECNHEGKLQWLDAPDSTRDRERAIMRKGLELATYLQAGGLLSLGQVTALDVVTIDAYLTQVK